MSLAIVYEQQAPFVRRSLRRFGVAYADADDAVQQVFLVVHRRFDEYAGIGAKRAWLFAVSRHVSRNYHRGLRRAQAKKAGFLCSLELPELDLEDLVAAREARRMVDQFLADLVESERRAFYLSHIEGLSTREIARELDVKLNTVYTRLRNARRRFDSVLARFQLRSSFPGHF